MINLSSRLKRLRKKHEYSLDTLSSMTGITKSYLSKLERGLNEPSISTVIKLAEAYNLSLSNLLGLEEKQEKVQLVKNEDLKNMDKSTNQFGYFYKVVAGNLSTNLMNSFIIYPENEEDHKEITVPHEGEEFIYILGGKVKILIENEPYYLSKGDSIYFNSSLPHQVYSVGDDKAEALVVVSRRKNSI